jgi:putative MFS transporter
MEHELKVVNLDNKTKTKEAYNFITPGTNSNNTIEFKAETKTEEKEKQLNNSLQIIQTNNSDEMVQSSIEERTIIDNIVNDIGISSYNFRIYAVLVMFFLADGAEMIVISLLITTLGKEWQLTESQKGFMGSAVFIGFFIGALLAGKIADTKGRKPTFIAGALFVFIFSSIYAFAFDVYTFLFLRALNGFGIGIAIPSSSSLAAEITPMKYRSWVLNLIWVCFPLGEIFAVIAAWNVLHLENGWRYLLALSAFPSLVSFIICFFIFESPRYYLCSKQYDRAFASINRILSYRDKEALTEEQKASIIKETEESEKNNNNLKAEYRALFNADNLNLTTKICTIFYVCSFVYYGIIYILPQTLEDNLKGSDKILERKEQDDMYKSLILSAITEIPSVILTSWMANLKCLGRIKSMIIGFIITIIFTILCGLFIGNITSFAAIAKFAISIPFGIIYLYVSEAYPTKIRSIGMGVSNSCSRLGGISTPFISQLVYSYNGAIPYYLYAIASLVGLLASAFLPFETLGRNIS